MLDFQVSQFPFRFGLAEGTEPHQVVPGTLTTLENGVWLKSGRLQKRFGTTALVATIISGGSVAAASRLFTRGSELCLVDGSSLYAYSPTVASWRTVGKVPNVGVTIGPLVDSAGGVSSADSAISAAGLRVDAWVPRAGSGTATGVFVQVTDVASGGVVLSPAPAHATSLDCQGVRVLIIGTTAIIITLTSATNIAAATIDLTTLTLAAASNLRTDSSIINGGQGWDACVIGSNFVIAYCTVAPLLKLYSYDATLVQQATGGITGEALGATSISIDGAAGEVLYVLYRQGNSAGPRNLIRIAIADPSTLAQTVAPVTIETPGIGFSSARVGVCRYDATNCIVAYHLGGGTSVRTTSYMVSSAAVVSATTQRGTHGALMTSRPFMLSGRCYIVLTDAAVGSATPIPTDRSTVLVEAETSACTSTYTPHRYVGSIDALVGGTLLQPQMPAAGVAVASATSVFFPSPFLAEATPSWNSSVRQGLRLVNFTVGASLPEDMWRSIENRDVFITGGILASYDGRTVFDYGFVRAPTFYTLTASNGAGSIVPGTYLYGMVLEYRSASGLLYRSPAQTSAGTVAFAGPSDTVTILATGFSPGNKQTTSTLFGASAALPTLLPWYRSTVGGSTYYRLTDDPSINVNYVDQMLESTTFVDLRADLDIGSSVALAVQPTLYTTGGILDDFAPPGCVTACLHVDRLWVLAGDQKTWWYSKAFQDDLGVAPGFHPTLRISFAETQTAMASMDDKAIFFSASGVKYMLGTGPAPSGLNSDFQTPTTIQSDVGCTSPRSVVTTPDGVMFLSARGLYLLTRGLELVWIGRPVKDQLALYPTITSAVLVAKQNQVRFTCVSEDGATGITLVLDYVEKQWSTFTHWVDGVYGGPIADACMWNGAWTFVSPAGTVYTESTTSYLDAGSSFVPMTLETAWIAGPGSQASPSSGPLKLQSVRNFALHGYSNTDHDLTIQCGFDTEAAYAQSVTFLATSPVTSVGALEECTISIGTRRKCNAIRFKITDATPSAGTVGTGQGPSFDMMALEVGLKRGTGNTPATKRG